MAFGFKTFPYLLMGSARGSWSLIRRHIAFLGTLRPLMTQPVSVFRSQRAAAVASQFAFASLLLCASTPE